MPNIESEVNKTYQAIKEFFDNQVAFHNSVRNIITIMTSALPYLDAEEKEKFEQLLKPYKEIQDNPFELSPSEAEIIYGAPEKNAQANVSAIQILEKKIDAVPPNFFNAITKCMAAYSAITDLVLSLSEEKRIEIEKRFGANEEVDSSYEFKRPVFSLREFIKPSQQVTRYAMPIEPLEKLSDTNVEIGTVKTKIIPTLKNIAIHANNHLEAITLKNKAIDLLISTKYKKLGKSQTTTRKNSIETIDKAIKDIDALSLADTLDAREQFVNKVQAILTATTAREDLGIAYSSLTESMRKFILRESAAKKSVASQPIASTPTANSPTERIDLTTNDNVSKIETTLGAAWEKLKINQGVIFEKKTNDQVTHSFVVKETSFSTYDKDADTYRTMIMAFKAANPKRMLRMRSIDEIELKKIETVCKEIQSTDANFKYSLTINTATASRVVEESTRVDTPTQPQTPLSTWTRSTKPENSSLENAQAAPMDVANNPTIAPPEPAVIAKSDNPSISLTISHLSLTSMKKSILESSSADDINTAIATFNTVAKEHPEFRGEIVSFHLADIEEKIKKISTDHPEAIQKSLDALKSTLDSRPEKVKESSSGRIPILSYMKDKITSGYQNLKDRYKKMSPLRKVLFWAGAAVAVTAFVGMVVGLSIATGGAAPAVGATAAGSAVAAKATLGTLALIKGLTVAGACALAGVVSGVISILAIKKLPKHDQATDLSNLGMGDEKEKPVVHHSNSDINESLGSHKPASMADRKSTRALQASDHQNANGTLAPLPTVAVEHTVASDHAADRDEAPKLKK